MFKPRSIPPAGSDPYFTIERFSELWILQPRRSPLSGPDRATLRL